MPRDSLAAFGQAIADVDAALRIHAERLRSLEAASQHAAAVMAEISRSIAAGRAQKRIDTPAAQDSMRATVIWASFAAILLGLAIAFRLGRSITRL